MLPSFNPDPATKHHNKGVIWRQIQTLQNANRTPEQKLKIVLESMQRDTTVEAVRIKYGVAASALHRWREEFKKAQATLAETAFGDKRNPRAKPSGLATNQANRRTGSKRSLASKLSRSKS